MPSHEKEDNSQSGSDKPIKPTSRSGVKTKSNNLGKEKTGSQKATRKEYHNQKPTVIVNIPPVDNTAENKIAKYSFWSVIVNGSLCIATIVLAAIAFYQYNSSKTAAQIAKETLDSAKSYQRQAVKTHQTEIEKNDGIETEKFKRDTATLNLQNFRYIQEHEPYIKVVVDTIYSKDSTEYRIEFTTIPSSETPIGIISETETVQVVPDQDTIMFLKNPFKNLPKVEKSNSYLFKNNIKPQKMDVFYEGALMYRAIKSKRTMGFQFYFFGKIIYKNFVNNKKRLYEFVINVSYQKNDFGYYYAINSNKDL